MRFVKNLYLIPILFVSISCLSFTDSLILEYYEPDDKISMEVLEEGRDMYFQTYLNPKLHENIPLEELNIDLERFGSYESFIFDMFRRDFESYYETAKRHYFQVKSAQNHRVIAVCTFLMMEEKGVYYLDHIGVHKDFRRQGIASLMLNTFISTVPDVKEIRLDTRVFNYPAQAFYENFGFERLHVNPNSAKQSAYIYYTLRLPERIFP